jgi:hypothetical protein
MRLGRFLAFVIVPGLLASCAPMSRYQAVDSPLLQQASQNARTANDHHGLSEHYENLAREMQTRAGEQQKLLDHYQEKSYMYGRQAQDRQSHTWALMVKYEQAAKTSSSKAAFHRQIAAELGHRNNGASAGARLTQARVRTRTAAGDVHDEQATEER